LLEIETDKAVMEVEAEAEGILAGISAHVGEEVPVGQVIAWLVGPGESIPENISSQNGAATAPQVVARSEIVAESAAAAQPSAPAAMQISPKARRLAKEAGIDLKTVRGTGPSGEIQSADIHALINANASKSAEPPAAEVPLLQPLSSIGRLVAERTTQSWTTVPHFFVEREVDASALNSARATLAPAIEQEHGVKLTHTDLLVAIVARTLPKHPSLNASWTSEGIRLNPAVNISIAIAVEDGVVAAVVPNAHLATLAQITQQRRDLADRARAGRLRPADLAGGTFTVSNLGMFKVDSFSAIITPPQTAILAVGAIVDRAVVVNGCVAVRPTFRVTLSVDHRVADGAKAAAFLQDFAVAIGDAEKLLR